MGNIITYQICILCHSNINNICIKCIKCKGIYHYNCYCKYITKKDIIYCPFCKSQKSMFESTKHGVITLEMNDIIQK